MKSAEVTESPAAVSPADPYERDEKDNLPLWPFTPGLEMVEGIAAWDRLGVGHRCETWLAWSTERCAPVVVKIARPHQVNHPRAAASLTREATFLGGLSHPSFASLLENHVDSHVPYIVTEFIEGAPLLLEVEDEGPFNPADTLLLGIQLAAGLRNLHLQGICHLDIKPGNIMVRDGRPVIIDLGGARPIGFQHPGGSPGGSAGYASPEMERCEEVCTTMDVFGLGAVLYFALTGEDPFGHERQPLEAWAAPRRPSQVRPGVPRSMDAPILSLLRMAKEDRPQNMDEVLRLLCDTLPRRVSPPFPPWMMNATRPRVTLGSPVLI